MDKLIGKTIKYVYRYGADTASVGILLSITKDNFKWLEIKSEDGTINFVNPDGLDLIWEVK